MMLTFFPSRSCLEAKPKMLAADCVCNHSAADCVWSSSPRCCWTTLAGGDKEQLPAHLVDHAHEAVGADDNHALVLVEASRLVLLGVRAAHGGPASGTFVHGGRAGRCGHLLARAGRSSALQVLCRMVPHRSLASSSARCSFSASPDQCVAAHGSLRTCARNLT